MVITFALPSDEARLKTRKNQIQKRRELEESLTHLKRFYEQQLLEEVQHIKKKQLLGKKNVLENDDDNNDNDNDVEDERLATKRRPRKKKRPASNLNQASE